MKSVEAALQVDHPSIESFDSLQLIDPFWVLSQLVHISCLVGEEKVNSAPRAPKDQAKVGAPDGF
ncbi:hypothetical protein [Streptomyces sp. NRRL B-1347]|uniref:hypothetical protein n=1 Tax=Streptomyces sp. NRRL B-1347 TaxID=1476877 RepID=UPI00131B333B|nr:hypothetical protein [Streptomyces sp. NRRL B-1347]